MSPTVDRYSLSLLSPVHTSNVIQYDTIGYIYVRSKADDMASLVQRTAQKQKIKEKTENKNQIA